MATYQTNHEKRRPLPGKFRMKLAKAGIICLFLVAVNCVTSPHCGWVYWIIIGWGLSLSLEFVSWYYNNKEEKL